LKTLIQQLGLNQKFEKHLFEGIRKGDLYLNEIINALRIAKELKSGSLNSAFIAPMQSGKTGTIKHLCNLILPAIDFLDQHESILFLTSMTDTDLKNQNISSLEGFDSNIYVMPMHKFKSYGVSEVDKLNVKLIVRDEDQYGCGKESSFDRGFFNNARKLLPNLPLLSVSATPFDVLDANIKGHKIDIIHGLRHQNYFGISEMIDQGMIKPLSENYEHFQVQEDKSFLSKEIKISIAKLQNSQTGFGVIRCRNTSQAVELKTQLSSLNEKEIEVIIVGCKKEADQGIKDGLSILYRKIRVERKKVILLVINALSAGKDLKKLKSEVRFIIEIRSRQIANCVQGLPGRVCGYHDNREILIFANRRILDYYSDFESNPDLFNNEDWITELFFDEKINSMTTQLKLQTEDKEGYKTPIESYFEINVQDLFTPQGEDLLSFLEPKEYTRLLSSFAKEQYDNTKRLMISQNEEVQIRTASNYRKYNSVYKNWDKQEGDDIKGLFNHQNKQAKYGLLVSNFPVHDPRNEIGFCGVKLFIPGKSIHVNNLSKTFNTSMYLDERKEVE